VYSPFDCYERESVNNFVQKPVEIPSIFLIDDTAKIIVEPKYDEYDDDVFMDDEIIEVLLDNPFQHQNIQENVQQTIMSLSVESEEISNPIADFHIPPPERNEHVSQSCQIVYN